jgi:hypothetical protein
MLPRCFCLLGHGVLILVLLTLSCPAVFVYATDSGIQLNFTSGDGHGCSIVRGENEAARMVLVCSIIPSDNSFVDNLLPTKAFGGLSVLIVQNTPSVPTSKNYAFLKFDLATSLPPALVESMAKPANASLRLYVRLTNFYENATVEVHNASPDNWTENTITWNNMPQIDLDTYATTNVQQNGTWARWDLTHPIQPVFNATGNIAFAAISPQTAWRNLVWFDSKEYAPSNGTTAPSLDLTFTEPYLTIETPYPSIPISVGSESLFTDSNGTARVMLPWGRYQVSVPQTIPIRNGTRAAFERWSDDAKNPTRLLPLGNNMTLRAEYGLQHKLDVTSPFGLANGSGWYYENTIANISVIPRVVPIQGISGWLGGRYVFDHWSGGCATSSPKCSIMMSAPTTVAAIWRVDWTQTIVAIIALAFVTAIIAVLRRQQEGGKRSKERKRKRKHSRHRGH